MPGDSTSATRLSPTQQALLEARLKRGRKAEGPSKALGSIPRGPEDGPAPCSFAQERFWLIHQFDPGGAADHQPRAYRLTGPLDVTVLTQALADLSLRHDVLRTVYDPPGPAGGPPSQRILPELDLRPERVDLTVFPADERLGRAVDLARALARRPFDLVRGPLTRVLLARLGIEEHLLLLDLHHSLCDGWSAGVLLRDLAALYDSAARGMPSRLAPLPIRYADYARWQRAQAATEGASRNLRGWLEALEGAPQILELPTDRPRPTAPTDHGVRATLSLGPPLSEAIDGLSRAEGATSFMTLLAGFAVMAHRFSGENDLLVGAPVAGRSRPETEGLVGAFMNILPLRLRPEPELSFRALLRQIRATTLAAVGREDLPFERLVEALRPSREPGRSPLTQVEFQLRNLPDSASKTGDLTWEEFDVDFGIARFDLSFTAVNTPLGYDLHLVAMADLYDQETAARMLGHYRTLLTAAVAAPERTIGELPLLTRAERIEAVEGRNATTMDLPFETCVHRLFEAQVARSPDAIAVTAADVDGDGSLTPTTLTYAELNRRANRLAHHLRDLGAVPESLVLVVLEQSPETLVAVLGILKSGAAYLPIEPETPAARLRALAEDARPVVVVTRPELVAELAFLGVPVVALSDAENDPAGPDANPQPVDRPNDLIYVLYTSGSTGMPKGVMLEHRAICNHLLGLQRLLPAGPTDRVALTMPLTFDPSVWELYRPLVVGARVVVAKQGGHRDPEYLARLFAAEGVTEAHFVPSMLGPFLDVGGVDQCDAIRRVICVGEALTADLRDRFFARFGPERELDNAYGPTEAAVSVTHHRCRPDEGPGPVPIGRPQANVTVHVLDDRLEPQPIGVPGELYLGGVCVARGYLNAPELTAARFVPDPFSKDSRARLYRTGDRGRVRADGAIEYLDRLDRQFKLRGIRMEPGEVEAALRRHSGVADVVVTALEDGAGNDRLVAYVVPTGTEPIDAPRLRSFLKDDLPAHLIPSAYVTLPKLPLTATGKLDRRALPRPEVTDLRGSENGHLAPRDDLERRLVAVWEEVFDVRPIGVRDDFFDLGGYSLLAVQLFARMEKAVGTHLPLSTLLRRSTIEALADVYRNGRDDQTDDEASLVPIRPDGRTPPLYLVPGRGGPGLAPGINIADLSRAAGPDLTLYSLTLPRVPENVPTNRLVREIAEQFVKEIRAFQSAGPYHLGGHSFGGLLAFEMACLLHDQGERVDLLAVFDTRAPGYQTRLTWSGRLRYHSRKLQDLPTQSGLAHLAKSLRASVRNRIRPIRLKRAADAYRERPRRFSGKVTLFRAKEHAEAVSRTDYEFSRGWSALATEGAEVLEIRGDHVTMLQEPGLSEIAKVLRERLGAGERNGHL